MAGCKSSNYAPCRGLEIMDIAVVIAVSSPHRKVAYEANEYAIERIKRIVPIWKRILGRWNDVGWRST